MKLYPKLVKKTLRSKGKTDLVIAGLGWVTVEKPGTVGCMESKEVDSSVNQRYLKRKEAIELREEGSSSKKEALKPIFQKRKAGLANDSSR